MRFIKVLLCFAVAATASSSAFTATEVDPARTIIYVNIGAEPGGDGSFGFPYRNLRPALKKAGATAGAVTIRVAPGRYVVNSTLVIDRPLLLRGSSELVKDPDGLPTGEVLPGTETRIVAGAGLGAEPLISVGRADGDVISRVTIRNLVLTHADPLATQLSFRRVQDYRVSNNVFRTGGGIGLESIASSGEVIGNHFSGLGTGAFFAAGYPESPSNVLFKGNRSVDNGGRRAPRRCERVHSGARRSAFRGCPGQRLGWQLLRRAFVHYFSRARTSRRHAGDRTTSMRLLKGNIIRDTSLAS